MRGRDEGGGWEQWCTARIIILYHPLQIRFSILRVIVTYISASIIKSLNDRALISYKSVLSRVDSFYILYN